MEVLWYLLHKLVNNTRKQTICHHSKPQRENHAENHHLLWLLFYVRDFLNEQRKICIMKWMVVLLI